MLKRFLPLLAALAVLAPAAALADDGTTSGDRDPGARLAASEQRVDARFQTFAAHCLVAGAPEKCAHAAARFVHRLDALQGRIDHLEGRIKEKCGRANPPARCAHAADLLAKLDAFKSKLADYESRIKAKYPSAG